MPRAVTGAVTSIYVRLTAALLCVAGALSLTASTLPASPDLFPDRGNEPVTALVATDLAAESAEVDPVRRVEEPVSRARRRQARSPVPASPPPATRTSSANRSVPGPPSVATVPSGAAGVVVAFALAQVGKPYRYGASGPGAYDCSGLVMVSYARVGIRLPHQSGKQRSAGRAVSRAELRPGDLIVYSGHVAIFARPGWMIHAANPRKGVVYAPIYGSPSGFRRLL